MDVESLLRVIMPSQKVSHGPSENSLRYETEGLEILNSELTSTRAPVRNLPARRSGARPDEVLETRRRLEVLPRREPWMQVGQREAGVGYEEAVGEEERPRGGGENRDERIARGLDEGIRPVELEKPGEVAGIDLGTERPIAESHGLVVIPGQDANVYASRDGEIRHAKEHLETVGSVIDQVPEKDDVPSSGRRHGINPREDGLQGDEISVNIADEPPFARDLVLSKNMDLLRPERCRHERLKELHPAQLAEVPFDRATDSILRWGVQRLDRTDYPGGRRLASCVRQPGSFTRRGSFSGPIEIRSSSVNGTGDVGSGLPFRYVGFRASVRCLIVHARFSTSRARTN